MEDTDDTLREDRYNDHVDAMWLAWHTTSHRCMSNSQCVETAPGFDGQSVKVRDSTDREGPMLSFSMEDWKAFVKKEQGNLG